MKPHTTAAFITLLALICCVLSIAYSLKSSAPPVVVHIYVCATFILVALALIQSGIASNH
jgi:phosphatidylserine synthase